MRQVWACCSASSVRRGSPKGASVSGSFSAAAQALTATLAWVVMFAGCAGSDAAACRVDADCARGKCLADGSCAIADVSDAAADTSPHFGDADASAIDAGSGAVDAGHDASTEVGGDASGGAGDAALDTAFDTAGGADAGPGAGFTCAPNHDGRVERKELHFAAGLKAPFRVAKDVSFQSASTPGEGGIGVWNLIGPYAGEAAIQVETSAPSTAWYAKDVQGATYATQLAVDSPLLGVFEATGDALLLRAVVSPQDGLLRTRLLYDPPAQVLALPLEKGKSFSTTSTVKGEKDGVLALWTETWTSQVDANGIVQTPFGNFPALRVRTTLTRKVGLLEYVTRSLAWVAECFGTVASARSELGEQAIDFNVADELRRIAPP